MHSQIHLALWQNLPYAMILLPLISAAITSILKGKWAGRTALLVIGCVMAMAAMLVYFSAGTDSYTYMMGHFPAPWGNEIRSGMLEAITALFFAAIMFLSILGGRKKLDEHIAKDRLNLYFVMTELLMAALMAQVFTNDIFTAYVFLEIMTIAACSLITARTKGRTLVAATRYMIMNLLGSGLFLLGITLLYDLTGHLLLSNIQQAVRGLYESGMYSQPLTVVIVLMTVGLAIKSALFPFHSWVPEAYAYTTPTSASVLSSLVSKGYIFLLIKIYYRAFGLDVVFSTRIGDILYVFGVLGMIIGSLTAIRQSDIRRMIAFSSVAQIGYIFMGIGLGTELGMVAAIFHIFSHSICKAMLFLSAGELSDVSDDKKNFHALRGSGFRNPIAGATFCLGAFSMVGIPFLSGFISKVNFATAAMTGSQTQQIVILAALAVSTALNAVYFLKTVLTLYRPSEKGWDKTPYHIGSCAAVALSVFAVINLMLGIFSTPVMNAIVSGLHIFG